MFRSLLAASLMLAFIPVPARGLERPDVEFRIFQFPPNMIPTVDGKTDDWKIVGDEYGIGSDQLSDTVCGKGPNIDYGADKAVSKINGLTLHPYWERTPNCAVRWTLGK